MSNTIISPNMSLPIPIVSVDPGPDYALNLDACLSAIDSHNHSSGQGVPINPNGMNINADLLINNNNLTLIRSVRFTAQGSPLAGASDLGCLYESGVDLYYNDGNGNQIRITQSGTVAGASGTITGLPSGTASASYSTGTFTFQSATATPANVDGGSFIFRNISANSKGVTVSAPSALGSNYALVWPQLPAQTNVMTLDTSGNMGSTTYDAIGQGMTSVGANAITISGTVAMGTTGVARGGMLVTASCGSFSSGSASFTTATNLSGTMVVGANPIDVYLVPDGVSDASITGVTGSNTFTAVVAIFRGATKIGSSVLNAGIGGSSNANYNWPIGMIRALDTSASAGTATYSCQVQLQNGTSIGIANAKLVAREQF